MSKTLVAYFSRAAENYFGGKLRYVEVGNTAKCAKMMEEQGGVDVFCIEMAEPYSDDYKTCVQEAKAHCTADARPAMKAKPESVDEYDQVFLLYPNYCGTMPMVLFTFLEAYDFTGKTIYPLCTNEGSGVGKSVNDIKRLCPGAVVDKGLSINGSRVDKSKSQIIQWMKERMK